MRLLSVSIVLAGMLCFSGCKKASPLVGTWETQSSLVNVPLQSELTFDANGTFKDVTTSAKPGAPAKLTATDTGTWKLEGNQLTTKVTDVDWQFTGSNPAFLQKARDRFLANKDKILASANEHPTETITWKGNDEFSYTDQGKTDTFHRKQ